MKSNKNVTINDIAASAGVSKTTVSRYINGQENLMSEKTRDRIKTVIKLLDYHPSNIARSLKSKKTYMVGVLISDITSPFSSAVITGISSALANSGYTPLIVSCEDSPEKEEKYVRGFLSRQVDGLIVNTTSTNNKYLISVACSGVPVILCDRYIKDYNFDIASTKSDEMLLTMIGHLKQQGFTRPAMFSQEWETNSSRYMRRDAFLRAVKKVYGYDAEKDIYLVHSGGSDNTYERLKKFMSSVLPGEIPAIFGVNSVTTVRVYHAIRDLDLSMPSQIGLCGPEDWDWDNGMNWPEIVETKITTMKLHARELGRQSAKLLLNRIEYPEAEAQKVLLSSEIVVRQSTLRIK